jgi:hypothetical protein
MKIQIIILLLDLDENILYYYSMGVTPGYHIGGFAPGSEATG